MQRFVGAAVAAVLLLMSCSTRDAATSTSGDGTGAEGSRTVGTVDPIDSFCEQWPPYVEFVDSVEVPTEELVAQLLAMEDSISEVLPGELGEAWRGVVDWNTPFLDLLERIGYQPITDEIFLEAFDGDEERAAAAVEAREAGFEATDVWVATNCGGGGGDTTEPAGALPVRFCSAWDEFVT